MEKENNSNYIKLTDSKQDLSSDISETSFNGKSISEICPRLTAKKIGQVHRVLEYIKENEGCSMWDCSADLSIPNSTLHYIIKTLTEGNVIFSKLDISPNNKTIRRLYFYVSNKKPLQPAEQQQVSSQNKSGDTNENPNN